MHEAAQGDPVEASRPRARHEHEGRHGSPDGAVQQAAPQDVLPREMARADRTGNALSVAMFDIDRFGRINDSFGHATGDKVLVALSRVAAGSLRATDHLVR